MRWRMNTLFCFLVELLPRVKKEKVEKNKMKNEMENEHTFLFFGWAASSCEEGEGREEQDEKEEKKDLDEEEK